MSRFASQRFFHAILATGLLLAGQPLHAQNKYDILARTLQPYGALFYSKATTKALEADVVLRDGPAAAAEILNKPLRVSLQIPDKLRIETIDPQRRIVFCRDGQNVWAYPRDFATGIIAAGRVSSGETRIPDFRLPLKDQEIVFIPALFQILQFESGSDPGGKSVWRLDLRLMPEFAEAIKSDNWVASAVVNQDNFYLRRVRIKTNRWTGTVDVLATRFERALPPQTWKPEAELASEATLIPPECVGSAWQRIPLVAMPR
ncbi:MAG: hypothetical protein JO207_04190 [Verrucomicrobia bacterium]|nr:hypothetical protein [Verrucomicrobiota bacterium]